MSADPIEARSFADSLSRLRGAQKSSRGAPIYSVLINRPLGRFFAAAAHQLGMTPDQVTAVSAVSTLTGIALLAVLTPSWAAAIAVAALLVLGYALDAADGQLARLRGGGSLAGEWLDHVIDSFKIATLHLAVLITATRHFDVSRWWLLVPLVFAAVYVVHFFGMLLTDLLSRVYALSHPRPDHAADSGGGGSRLLQIAKLPTDYGLLCLSFVLLALPAVFVWSYAILAVAMVGYTVLVLPVWYLRIRRLGQSPPTR